ncbi:LOW QUALITY PROTEIN: protein Son-like [Panonychus citri]|uniref:LOW QUALITY PROTEIN: protein Son-like n=1 Tax=Panonychus citri TaxID=50023 RepID=UPI002307B839|nr:LOW QUALITY PROTEIN: protein Son-like [Panonychus citri]
MEVTEDSHHGEKEIRKHKVKKKRHKSSEDPVEKPQLEEGEIPADDYDEAKVKLKKKKKKSDCDKEKKSRKNKKEKSHSKGFYNLDDYSKSDLEKRRKKSTSPIERTGIGYHEQSSNQTDHRREDRHSNSNSYHRHRHHEHRSHRRSSRSHERDRKRRRSRSRSQSVIEKVDKEKLLQIAKANLARMIKAGTLPKGVDIDKLNLEQLKNLKEKNSISQWSEYCRALSVMEAATNEDSADSDLYSDSDENSDTKSVCSAIVRHPFQLKERKDIQIKVKDFAILPTRSSKEIQKELTEKFPVSFGDSHRIKELEWVVVKPTMPPPSEIPKKRTEKRVFKEVKESKEPPVLDQVDSSVSSSSSDHQDQETSALSTSAGIGALVALRFAAKKKLQEDPLNLVALRQMYEAERLLTLKYQEQSGLNLKTETESMESEQKLPTEPVDRLCRPGIEQFTEKNKIKDGIGMHLLMKMGWQPGKGLGKDRKGPVDPLIPSLKFDTKGLLAEEETVSKIPKQVVDLASVSDGKSPISLLGEYCAKNRYSLPVYEMVDSDGPPHKKSFIMKVIVNEVEYRPSVSCGTKKQAKALAASVALEAFGLTVGE